MATTGTQILQYQGNPNLALGSDVGIPVTTNKDLDLINQTSRDIYLNNISRNQMMFQRKLADRDKLLQALDEGTIKVGDLLEGDDPWVREGLDKMDTAFDQWTKKGINNIEAAREYKKAKREAQERVTQAQARKKFYDEENAALSSEKLPRRQQARRENLNKVINSNKWADLTPYQQTLDLDFDPIKGYVKPVTTEIADPNRPLYKGKRTYVDLEQTKGEATKDFLENNEVRENQIGLFNEYQNLPIERALQDYGAIQRRLVEYNKQRGFKPGDKGYAELKIAMNSDGSPIVKDGRLVLNESVPDFAAKWALAQQPNYQTDAFDVDKGALDIAELRERERHNKAMEGIDRSKLNLQYKEFDFKANQAGAPNQLAQSAKVYAETLLAKLNSMKNIDGIIPRDRLNELTSDELKYLGKAITSENKFTLKPVELNPEEGSPVTNMVIDSDGTIRLFSGTKEGIGSQIGPSINVTTIATNKLGDEMVQTAGKEGYNFNNLIPLYENKKQETELSTEPTDWKQEGKYWRYKDGRLFDAKGKEVKQK